MFCDRRVSIYVMSFKDMNTDVCVLSTACHQRPLYENFTERRVIMISTCYLVELRP
jgi:hypothetical protein